MTTDCPAKQPVPVIAVHGDADALVDYEGGNVAGFELGNPGVEERMAELAKLDGCKARPRVAPLTDVVTKRLWTGCTKGNDVVLFTIAGGPHVWPGADAPVDATLAILDFFDAHGGDAAA
jgi:polyhydroxybutyrate depolymerase